MADTIRMMPSTNLRAAGINAARKPPITAPITEPEDHRAGDANRQRVGQEPRHVLGQVGLHDQRRVDHHQEHEDEQLQQALGDAMHQNGADVGRRRHRAQDHGHHDREQVHQGREGERASAALERELTTDVRPPSSSIGAP